MKPPSLRCILIALGLAIAPGISKAQARPRDAAVVLSELRGGSLAGALEILTQLSVRSSRSQLDEVAHAVADLGIASGRRALELQRGSDAESAVARAAGAVFVLSKAARGEGGIPYDASAELMRIARAGLPVSAEAAIAFERLPDRPASLQYLREIAASDAEYGALGAVSTLERMGADGTAILHELHAANSMQDRGAKAMLEVIARIHGWPGAM